VRKTGDREIAGRDPATRGAARAPSTCDGTDKARRAAERVHLMFEGLRSLRAVLRSVRIYYGDAQRNADMKRLYGGFVRPGDLVFDIGAHVGDRVRVFRHLGARVIAVEPQPALART